jgi:hypothetical protein
MNAGNDRGSAGDHLGELAELYTLGVLEAEERGPVEAHAAVCANCACALGAAEETLAVLDEIFVPQLEPPERLASRIAASAQAAGPALPARRVLPDAPAAPADRPARAALPEPRSLAAAAAVLLAIGIGGGVFVERSAQSRQAARDSAILATIASSHFNHVSFTSRGASGPVSKVLYARDGSWFYVVIDSATCACRVLARSARVERDLGKPAVRASTATLFVRDFPRPSALELVDASGRIVSTATLAYPAR